MNNPIKHRFKVDKLIRDNEYNDIMLKRIMEDEAYDQRLKEELGVRSRFCEEF